MEKSICNILYERKIENEIKKGKGTGFFCEINDFPIEYALFTNSHVLNINGIKLGNIIKLEYINNLSWIENSLVSSNLNNIIISIIKNMDRLFYNCNSLISLLLSNLNPSSVGVMLNIHSSYSLLEFINLTNYILL